VPGLPVCSGASAGRMAVLGCAHWFPTLLRRDAPLFFRPTWRRRAHDRERASSAGARVLQVSRGSRRAAAACSRPSLPRTALGSGYALWATLVWAIVRPRAAGVGRPPPDVAHGRPQGWPIPRARRFVLARAPRAPGWPAPRRLRGALHSASCCWCWSSRARLHASRAARPRVPLGGGPAGAGRRYAPLLRSLSRAETSRSARRRRAHGATAAPVSPRARLTPPVPGLRRPAASRSGAALCGSGWDARRGAGPDRGGSNNGLTPRGSRRIAVRGRCPARCRAHPPLHRWVAAAARSRTGEVILFRILGLWQMPHFWALALRFR